MRSRSKAVLLALWLGAILCAPGGYVRAEEAPLEPPSPNDAVFTIGQWEFRIPSAYVGMAGKNGALLNAVGPDFRPKSGPSKAGWSDTFLMLVEPKPAYTTLQTWLTVDLDFITPYHAAESEYGLERFVSDNTRNEGSHTTNDVFIERDSSGNIKTELSCNRPGSVESPGCKEAYISEGSIISIRFSRDYLPLWRSIRVNFSIFLYDHGRKIR